MTIWTRVSLSMLIFLQIATGWCQKQLTVEDIYGTSKFSTKTLNQVQWIPQTRVFTHYKNDKASDRLVIESVDAESGISSILISSDKISDLIKPRRENRFTLPNYHWAPDGQSILIPSAHDIVLVSMPDQKTKQLTDDPDEERDPAFSPDGKYLAYLKHWNLQILNLQTGDEIPLTTHGTGDLLIGRFDWVYEEEFHIRTGFSWSPDSRSIAFYELDTSREPEVPITDYLPLQNTVEYLKYTKAGNPNALVRIGVVSVQSKKTVWMDLGNQKDQYIPRIHWLPDGEHLVIQRLNRKQNRLDLLIADIRTGRSRVVITEEDKHGWVEFPEEFFFLEKQSRFIWLSERSNWNHAYLCDLNGRVIRPLTSGNWNVTEVLHLDEEDGWLYFRGTKTSPLERQLYRVSLDGGPVQRISDETGTHSVQFSDDGRYYLDVFSSIDTPPRTTLHQSDGQLVRLIEKGDIPALKDYELSTPEFFTIPTEAGFELNAFLMKPKDFDPTHKYPVLVYTYGCPGSQIVYNSWTRGQGDLWHQLMLQQGTLIFGLDNRGMDHMGNAFKNLAYRDLSKGLDDLITGAQYLKHLAFIDSTRIGIHGWSGGGWMTCLAMTKGAGYFKAGAAVAPMTDLRNYDTIWMERYMGLPDDNPKGYASSNVLDFAGSLEGSLLLIHGVVDDNVHFANTMQLVQTLQDSGKTFEMMAYPNKKHSIRGKSARIHLYKKMTDFFLKNL
ncbi:S9 family peptidase [candidate division KSB1 bacterium]|nr:S9 family peptidase [candidate division KSB1 bacterium]